MPCRSLATTARLSPPAARRWPGRPLRPRTRSGELGVISRVCGPPSRRSRTRHPRVRLESMRRRRRSSGSLLRAPNGLEMTRSMGTDSGAREAPGQRPALLRQGRPCVCPRYCSGTERSVWPCRVSRIVSTRPRYRYAEVTHTHIRLAFGVGCNSRPVVGSAKRQCPRAPAHDPAPRHGGGGSPRREPTVTVRMGEGRASRAAACVAVHVALACPCFPSPLPRRATEAEQLDAIERRGRTKQLRRRQAAARWCSRACR